jgi:hypothetical protein
MLRRMRFLAVQLLAICVLTPLVFSAPVMLGKIYLYDPPTTTPPTPSFEKFGVLHYVFQFQGLPPNGLLFVLCETGVDSTGCVNQNISDFVCVTNNQAGEGTVAMMSDLETPLVWATSRLTSPASSARLRHRSSLQRPERGKFCPQRRAFPLLSPAVLLALRSR